MENDLRSLFGNNMWLLILGAFLLLNSDFNRGGSEDCGERASGNIFGNLQCSLCNIFDNKSNWIWIAALAFLLMKPNLLGCGGIREEL